MCCLIPHNTDMLVHSMVIRGTSMHLWADGDRQLRVRGALGAPDQDAGSAGCAIASCCSALHVGRKICKMGCLSQRRGSGDAVQAGSPAAMKDTIDSLRVSGAAARSKNSACSPG